MSAAAAALSLARRASPLRLVLSSLRARLLVFLLSGLMLAGSVGGWFVYRNALDEADTFFDYNLMQTALLLRQQPVEYLAPRLPAAYDFVVQIWTLDGVLAYYGYSQPHTHLPARTTLGFSTVSTQEGRWRVYGVRTADSVIQVAQPMRVRERPAAALAMRALKPFLLMLPVLGVLIWLTVGLALEPLRSLAGEIKTRHVDAIEPLPDTRLPEEVRPLVAALNELLARLDAARDRERAFMADAAHELRTPLTALHLQLSTLARAGTEVERSDAMAKLAAGVQRAIRLIEQMLSLARQEPRASTQRGPLSLSSVARGVVSDLMPLADAKQIDLGVSRADEGEILVGDAEGVRALLRNLVDNAVRYTGAGGQVDVGVELSPAGAILRVIDNGPGIPPAERSRVFDRFYRRPGMEAPGSGLGMAIVKAVADAHGAAIELADRPGGAQGLAVAVTFPPSSFLRNSAAAGR
jgi:two-component system, OmpR family, sensor kinase